MANLIPGNSDVSIYSRRIKYKKSKNRSFIFVEAIDKTEQRTNNKIRGYVIASICQIVIFSVRFSHICYLLFIKCVKSGPNVYFHTAESMILLSIVCPTATIFVCYAKNHLINTIFALVFPANSVCSILYFNNIEQREC